MKPKMIKTRTIALVTATALSLTAVSATQTQANETDNIVRFIVGAAVIGALVNAANNSNRHAPAPVTRRYDPDPDPVYQPAPVYHPTRHVVRARDHKPNRCLFQRWSRHGWKQFYGRKCMIRHGWSRDNRGWYQTRVAYW